MSLTLFFENDYAFTARAARNARRSAQFRMGGEGGKPSWRKSKISVSDPSCMRGCRTQGCKPELWSLSGQAAGLHPCFQTGWVSNLFGAARKGHTCVLRKKIKILAQIPLF